MEQIIKIGNHDIAMKEFNGQRVVTFKDIDTVHERPDGTARKRFNDNKERLRVGKDYFVRKTDEAKEEYGIIAPNGLILITERGYLMLVKSFTDDLAWEVQGQLVDTYFRAKKPLSALEQLSLQSKAIIEVNEKVDDVKQDLPLLGCDMDRITTAVKKMGVKCLGGKDSNAYHDKSLRSRVYTDIYDQLKRQFGVSSYKSIKRGQCDTAIQTVTEYRLPLVLSDEIEDCNAQGCFA